MRQRSIELGASSGLKDGDNVRLSQIEAAAAIWSQPKGRRCDRSASPKARTRFVNHAVRWLRFLGWLDEADDARHRHGAEVETYEAWMRGDRGLSEETIRDYRAAADQFFDWLAATDIPLASVRITDIDAAITARKAGELAAEERCTITLSVFARSFALPRRAAGPRRA